MIHFILAFVLEEWQVGLLKANLLLKEKNISWTAIVDLTIIMVVSKDLVR